MTDDAELLRRYAEAGTEAAFAELVEQHLNLVYRAALRRTNGDTHRAADVSQVVFTALARDAAKLARHPLLTGWLYTATRHTADTAMRAQGVISVRSDVRRLRGVCPSCSCVCP